MNTYVILPKFKISEHLLTLLKYHTQHIRDKTWYAELKPKRSLTCVDGADDVLLRLYKRHQRHHHPHGAGQGLLRAVAGVDRLSGLTQHKHMLFVAPPCLAGHVLLFGSALRRGVAVEPLLGAFLSHQGVELLFIMFRWTVWPWRPLGFFLSLGGQVFVGLCVIENSALLTSACIDKRDIFIKTNGF